MPLPHDPGPHWGEVGIHGLHRQREWDAVITVEAPDVPGDEGWFVVLAGGQVLIEELDGAAARLARAIAANTAVPCPCRQARTLTRGRSAYAGSRRSSSPRICVATPWSSCWDGAERSVRIDGEPTLAGVPELERLGASRHRAYVVTATRLTGSIWEVSVAPL